MAHVKPDVSRELGRLLLSRFTMLAENCVSCQIPLMKDPSSGNRVCVNCNTTTPEGSPQQPQPQAKPEVLSSATRPDAELGDVRADAEAFGPFAMRVAAPAAVPRLANGPIVPEQSIAPATATGSDLDLGLQSRPWRRQKNAQQDQTDAADLIAQRMLQGWALLDQYCPRCNEVLIRSRDRRIFCVRCNAHIQQEQHQTTNIQPTSPNAMQHQQQDTEEAVLQAEVSALPLPAVPPRQGGVGLSLERTLVQKCAEVEELIQATPVSMVSKCRERLQLLQELLLTLKDVRELQVSQ